MSEGTTAIFRLYDDCSSTQAKLVGIPMALLHAEETVTKPVIIHRDFMTGVQAICRDRYEDNICLITFIWRPMEALESAGRRATLNWLPSHSGVKGNESADAAAKDATLLPAVTVHLSLSTGHLCTTLLSRAGRSITAEPVGLLVPIWDASGWLAAPPALGLQVPVGTGPRRRQLEGKRALREGLRLPAPTLPSRVPCYEGPGVKP